MARTKIQEVVYDIAKPIVDEYGFELVDVEYVKEGSNWFLRVYIDKDGGINIDDCQAVSEKLSTTLDEIDPIDHAYFLEVSSPGLDRPLKTQRDFEKYRGSLVEVKLFKSIDGKKVFEGTLEGLVGTYIVIMHEGEEIRFPKENVALVKRVITF